MSQTVVSGTIVKSLFSSCFPNSPQIPEKQSFTFDEVCNLLLLVPNMDSKRVFEQYLNMQSTLCEHEHVAIFQCLALLKTSGEEKCVPYEYPLLFIYKQSSRKHCSGLSEYYQKNPHIGKCCTKNILKAFLDYSAYFRKKEDIKAVLQLVEEDIISPLSKMDAMRLEKCKKILLKYLA